MTRNEDLTAALRDLTAALSSRIQGLPDHPWVPGGEFADGGLMAALRRAERVLDPPASDYPEHDRLAKISDRTQAVGDFLDWASTEGWQLAEHDDGYSFRPIGWSRERLIGAWAEIDPDKLEAEKRAMLDLLRAKNGDGS